MNWFGDMPSHWDCKKIGALFSERKTKVSDKEYSPLSVTKMGIVPQLDTAAKTDAGDNRKLVCAGDFVINSRSDRKGSCGVSKLDGSVSLINIVLTPRDEWNRGYVHYLMRSQPFSEEYYRNGRGIVADLWTTRFSEMKSILLPVPPRAEQDRIVRFLDWKVSGINKLIKICRDEISLLEEMKRTLISNTVSGLKDMGNCKFQRLKSIAKCNASTLEETTKPDYSFRYVDIGAVDSKRGITKYTITTFVKAPTRARRIVRTGDIIISTVRTYLRAITKIEDSDNVIVSTGFAVITPVNADSKYLEYCFKSNQFCDEVIRKSIGIAYPAISASDLMNIRIPVFDYETQQKIADFLTKKCQIIDKGIESKKAKVKELDALKKRLISDVVTGKVNVQDVAIPEYEFIGEEADADADGRGEEEEGTVTLE